MKFLTLFTVILLLTGCSGEQISHNITKMQIAMSGNKPPAKYRVANLQTMKDYTFETKDFSFKLPTAIQSDFTKMGGWWGASHRDGKTITSHLNPVYHVTVSTSGNVLKYGERDRALENNNIQYLRSNIRIDKNDNLYIRRYGKENYICQVMEYTKEKYPNSKYVGYSCYKYNIDKTKAKRVHIRLTYTRSKDPNLAKQYTYEDLKKRAKRTLDSLYIKDGW